MERKSNINNIFIEKDWITKAGLRAVCVKNDLCRCGYVAIDKKNVLYGKQYNALLPKRLMPFWKAVVKGQIGKRSLIDLFLCNIDRPEIGFLFDVHGGITYSSAQENSNYPVTAKDLWWFGFDCAHYGDKFIMMENPVFDGLKPFNKFPVRDVEYVVNECEQLARQLAAVGKVKQTLLRRVILWKKKQL